MTRLELRERLRSDALELGFDQVGFAPALEPPNASAYLGWLRQGRHGEMTYMAREDAVERRLEPEKALPGCRTLIMTSLSYAPRMAEDAEAFEMPSERNEASTDASAVVARYALGTDYHDVFEAGLARLEARVLELAPGERVLPYVDYGPVLERDHAQRAGLGWIGKNTMLIHPELGSYMLLGELLTTLELPPDEPFAADRCGTCRRCVDACPTGAIRLPRQLDARLCISYLTIELRGPIPVELRPLIGNRIFGCDICQEVCPWNEDARPGRSEELQPPEPGQRFPASSMIEWAAELLSLSEEDYRIRYRGSAMARPGRDGMLRNLCIGLGNSGMSEAIPVLRRCSEDGSELVREHARWALERVKRTREMT